MKSLSRVSLLLVLLPLSRASFAQKAAATAPAPYPSHAEWNRYLPAIAAMYADGHNEGPLHPSVYDTATFSGIPTALVDLKCCGAYTDEMYVVQIHQGKPVKARFHAPKRMQPLLFLQGASSMHYTDVQLNAKWNAVVTTSWDDIRGDDGVIGECRQDAYVWNQVRRRFDWTRKLSYHRQAPECGTFDAR